MKYNLIRLRLYGVTVILLFLLICIALLAISTIPQLILAIILGVALKQTLAAQGLRDLQSIERTVSYVGFKGSPQHEWLNEEIGRASCRERV